MRLRHGGQDKHKNAAIWQKEKDQVQVEKGEGGSSITYLLTYKFQFVVNVSMPSGSAVKLMYFHPGDPRLISHWLTQVW